ncbi:hypothetical protein [Clostridium saccharoperbutylacetonicum]|uniref:hypothetical protein n=1 Tax=Clostridium saccharoperbutylacetonicum TaxID=36745 RepID=UPI0039ED6E31
MSKKLNIIEASNMPYGTEFKVKIDHYYKYDDADRIRDNTKMIAINMQEGIRFKEYTNIEKASKSLINATFVPIKQPVSFMEAIEAYHTGENIYCEYGISTYSYVKGQILIDSKDRGISTVEILNGKWYIGEAEEE